MKKLRIVLVILAVLVLSACGRRAVYSHGIAMMEEGRFDEAIAVFDKLGDYKDSLRLLEECRPEGVYAKAVSLVDAGAYNEAQALFAYLGDYEDSAHRYAACTKALEYARALGLMEVGDYAAAREILLTMPEYKDSAQYLAGFFTVYVDLENWTEYFSLSREPAGQGGTENCYYLSVSGNYASRLVSANVRVNLQPEGTDEVRTLCFRTDKNYDYGDERIALPADISPEALIPVLADGMLTVFLHSRETSLPKLYFEGDLFGMQLKSDRRTVAVRYEDGEKSFEGFATINLQGTSSLGYRKKNYTMVLYKDPQLQETLRVDVGWGPQQKYCLKANWIDRTHARNIVTARLVSEINEAYGLHEAAPAGGAIDGFPVEIYLYGEFWGLYTFNIPKEAWLFAMDESNPGHIVLCGEGGDGSLFKQAPDFESWSVEVGPEDEQTLSKLETLYEFVHDTSDETFRAEIGNHFQLDALLNYYILADFAWMEDNTGKNMLLVTYDGKQWIPTLYDLDTTWGTHWSGKKLYDYESGEVYLSGNRLFRRLESVFAEELSQRYFALRGTFLTKEHIMKLFSTFVSGVPQETYLKEMAVWGAGIPGYGIDQIRSYLDVVIPRLDQKYAEMG